MGKKYSYFSWGDWDWQSLMSSRVFRGLKIIK